MSVPVLEAVPDITFRQQTWANGAGQTTELAAGPDRDHWQWRISLAHVEGDSDFSVLPGVRRQIAPLDGSLELTFDDGETLTARRLEVIAFDGARRARCHLPDGAGRDINLMLRTGAEGRLIVRPLLGSMVLLPMPWRRWFVYVLAGSCRVSAEADALDLGTNEAAWVQPCSDSRGLIDGAGELALIRLDLPEPRAL